MLLNILDLESFVLGKGPDHFVKIAVHNFRESVARETDSVILLLCFGEVVGTYFLGLSPVPTWDRRLSVSSLFFSSSAKACKRERRILIARSRF